MDLDEIVLRLQRLIDRLVRRLRLGAAPPRGRRRLLIVQIDGLSRGVLEQGLTEGHMPFLGRLLRRHGFLLEPMSVGLPTSTPAFQMAAMYGVRPDIPGFHYHDKRRRADVYFPRAGDAALVEAAQAGGRDGILRDGSTYGCVFTGGARNNLFSFTMIKRPIGAGLLPLVSATVVLGWVIVKSVVLSGVEILRAVLRFVGDPVGESRRGWKWLAIKLGISVWVRQLFNLAVARDLYVGVPAVYVNFLDYDVFAHGFGPRHPRALRALRRVDRSLAKLWRVLRLVPEHGYDLYILSDHGQAHCTPYQKLTRGRPIERLLFDEFLVPARADEASPTRPRGRRLARGIEAYRSGRAPGFFQRFLNYLAHDFLGALTGERRAHERDGVRVVSAGPNAFVYFLEALEPVGIEWIDQRVPGLADEISRGRGVGFVLARSAEGALCVWRGKRYRLRDGAGPFAGRPDAELVSRGIEDLMAMPCAGDLVIYGNDAPEGNVSFIAEVGAHAGPSADEMETFIVCPGHVALPSPLTHPIQLYPLFVRYQRAAVGA